MVENQSNLCRYPYLDHAIFQPTKIELVSEILSQKETEYS